MHCILTNQRRSFLYVAYLKVAARQVSVRCQQVSISMEVGRKDPWKRKRGLNLPSNRSKLNLSSIESGHGSSFLFSISLVSVLRLGFLYTTNAFILAIIFVFFFEDNLIFSITCVLYIYIRISIILESFFCYVSVIRPQGYYITFNFDTFFSRIFLLQKFSKAKFNHRK